MVLFSLERSFAYGAGVDRDAEARTSRPDLIIPRRRFLFRLVASKFICAWNTNGRAVLLCARAVGYRPWIFGSYSSADEYLRGRLARESHARLHGLGRDRAADNGSDPHTARTLDRVCARSAETMEACIMKNKLVMPILKWVGGKRQLIETYSPLLPKKYSSYCEPFIGGGALLFHLQPKKAYVNDINRDLIRVYTVIKNNVEELIQELSEYKNEKGFFYSVRDWDRDKYLYSSLSETQKAARIIYLNRTCYNGLYRVNNAGEFNSPFGFYRNPNIVNEPVLRALNAYFNKNDIIFSSLDYSEVLRDMKKGTFIYLDPPYDPVSETSNFTGYAKSGFTREEQIRLRKSCDDLDKRGINFMLSNSATPFILEQYAKYNITIVKAKRAINSIGTKRGNVDEVVVRNYE